MNIYLTLYCHCQCHQSYMVRSGRWDRAEIALIPAGTGIKTKIPAGTGIRVIPAGTGNFSNICSEIEP